jgi:glycosyltransferase involved in cell wall biosynthesis
MKVAHVTLYPPKGGKHISASGVASYSKNLITNLAEGGDQQIVICNTLKKGPEQYRENGIEVHRVFERTPGFVAKVHTDLKRADPDVIHIQQELALFGGIFTAYLLQWLVFLWRDRVVVTLHGVVDPAKIDAAFVKENNSKLPVWLVRLAFKIIYLPLMKWSAGVIVHEDYFKEIMVKSYGIQPEKITVIPHGVEPLQTADQTNAKKQLGLPPDANIALFMGYATGYKGIDLLIEGFSKYAENNKKTYLLIGAGKHPKLHDDPVYLKEYARLQAKAAKLLPKEQYGWQGFIDEKDITAYYSASDVSLYPYTTAMSSSGPMSFAIGYEKPFLVSSAFEDIFKKYPLLIFERSPESLAEKLDYFFTHKEEYNDFSRTLKSERSWSRMADRTQQTYRSITTTEGAYEGEENTITR